MRLTENVYLLSGYAYGLHPNVYGIRMETGMILIDTGLNAEDYACIQDRLQDWGLSHEPILAVLITHSHFDHSGNAHLFRKTGAKIYAGDGDAQGIELGDERTIAYTYSMEFPRCPVDVVLRDGDIIEVGNCRLEAIHVPGHSRGSMAFWGCIDGRSIMFTGDFIRSGENCQSAKLGFSGAEDYDPGAYMASLKRIRDWKPDVVLCGHHQPCMRDGWKLLDKAYTFALVNWREPSVKD